ncbi:unnamed protein product [Cuscuta epithymum]|uniref:Uncharacterized protein n=1 Tax=Cuscuta epithymum TaxID=186058 RepID=A0AAV0EXK9_9ASTE|nr:unnamed protein product [Cuscuta epithymum]
MRRLRREPPVCGGGPGRNPADLPLVLPVLHAGRDRSREPAERAGAAPLVPRHSRGVRILLGSGGNPNADLHLLRRSESPGHRAGGAGRSAAVLRGGREAGELRGVREVQEEGGGDGEPEHYGGAVREGLLGRR